MQGLVLNLVPVGAILGIASGVAATGLGFFGLTIRPHRSTNVAFSAFATIWGLSVVAANGARLASQEAAYLLGLHLSLLLLVPLYIPLFIFLAGILGKSHLQRRPLFLAGLFLPALSAYIVYAASPALFVEGGRLIAGRWETRSGPGASIATLNSLLPFAAGLAATWMYVRRERTETARSKASLVVAALAVYVAYRAASSLYALATEFDFAGEPPLVVAVRFVSRLACLGATLWVGIGAFRDKSIPWRELILACTIAPFLVGAGEVGMLALGLPPVDTVGLWRLALVALFAYAIVRYNLFDIEVKLHAAAGPVAYVAVAGVALVALWAFAGDALLSSPLMGGAATLGVAMVCAPAARLGRLAVARAAPQVRDPEYLYKRKVDVYRAALEESESGAMGERTEELFLSDLRRRLGISEAEHRILLLVVRSQTKYAKAPPLAPATAAAAKFEVLRELGRGASGRVVLAKDRALGREVVLKQPLAPWLLDVEGRERFLQEARVAARVRHPNVVAIYELLADADPPLIVMEHVRGGSLEAALAKRAKLPAAEATRLAIDMLDGLAAVHAAGIVHRDLKPSNVLLEPDGTAKVADFGIAAYRHGDDLTATAPALAATLSGTTTQPGSIAYMSPEQARGQDVDARTDLYACGAILYRALTGQHYVDLTKAGEMRARQIVCDAPPRLPHPDVPARVEAVLARALAKEPDRRYASAAEMRHALVDAGASRAAGGVTIPVHAADAAQPTRGPDPQ